MTQIVNKPQKKAEGTMLQMSNKNPMPLYHLLSDISQKQTHFTSQWCTTFSPRATSSPWWAVIRPAASKSKH